MEAGALKDQGGTPLGLGRGHMRRSRQRGCPERLGTCTLALSVKTPDWTSVSSTRKIVLAAAASSPQPPAIRVRCLLTRGASLGRVLNG